MNLFNTPERVARGAALLDDFYGSDRWVDKVSLLRLDITHRHDCVLGQVFGHYRTGMRSLGINRLYEYGFSGFLKAERAWKSEIRQRRNARQEQRASRRLQHVRRQMTYGRAA